MVHKTIPSFNKFLLGSILTHKEAHEHPVINCTVEVILEGKAWHLQLPLQVLPQHIKTHKDVPRLLKHLLSLTFTAIRHTNTLLQLVSCGGKKNN